MAKNQNTLIVIGDTTTATSIKPVHIAVLKECSRVTGWSLSRLLNEALDGFIECTAPVLMHSADPTTYSWRKRPTVRGRKQEV
jgi:hypothetical protein